MPHWVCVSTRGSCSSDKMHVRYQSVAEVVFVTAPRVESQWRTAGQSGDLGVGSDVLS